MDHACRPRRVERRLRGKECPLKADPNVQQRLLEVQALDSRLDQLSHRRRSLPELAEIDELTAESGQLRAQVVSVEAEISDLEREQARFETDIEQVRARKDRDQERLDSGAVSSARDLSSLQGEIASLERRQSELEDGELAVMERIEEAQSRLAEFRSRLGGFEERCGSAEQRRDASFTEIDADMERARTERRVLAADLPTDLLELYEKLRAQYGGVGAAALRQGRCEGCRLQLTPINLNQIRSAAPDTVIRCEECRRILVRTPESGL